MTPCPRAQWWMIREDDPTIKLVLGCRAYACPACGPGKIRERVRLAAWGASLSDWRTHLTLTLAPEDWQQCRAQVRDYLRRLRQYGNMEAAWTREANPKGTGYHVHMLCHGTYFEHWRLQKLWGGRHVWIDPVPCDVARYIGKTFRVAGYQVKAMSEVMKLNGGRAIHMSRGYLHGMTARGALRLMRKHRWKRVRATEEEMSAWMQEYLTDWYTPGKLLGGTE